MINDYFHKAHYHETDRMGITHHSNYIKWMEEARVDYRDQLGYARMECHGAHHKVRPLLRHPRRTAHHPEKTVP